jgi:hypothetical protein
MKRFTPFIISLVFFIFVVSPAVAKTFYKTYEVVEVTEKTIVLESSGGKKIEIDKSRRPTLKKGDKVRYDKSKDRLGVPVDKE